MTASVLKSFEQDRSRLFGLAYRMLGCPGEAEDAVQDTWLRYRESPEMENPSGWLTKVCARICLDRLKSAQRTREQYIGPWLPEPLLGAQPGPDENLDESLSVALLYVLEKLSAPERAVLILHDVFDYDFQEVGEVLGRTSAGCRKLAERARGRIRQDRPRRAVSDEELRDVSSAFFGAVRRGELDSLREFLRSDVELHSDGGGKAYAARKPVEGAEKVALFLRRTLGYGPSVEYRDVWFNSAPGLVIFYEGQPVTAYQVSIVEGKVARLFAMRNPDKLVGFAL